MERVIEFINKREVYGSIIIIILFIFTYKLITCILNKFVKRNSTAYEFKRKKTVIELLKNIIKYALLVISLVIVLDLYGVDVSSIVASLGIASAVGALALQDTLKDIISGSNIIMDNYYVVGDRITYNGFTGEVIQLGLRTTKILNVDGQVLTISNRNIAEVINLSQKMASVLVEVPTAYEEKTEKVEKVLNEVVEEIKTWETVNRDETSYLGIMNLADSSVIYGFRIYCNYENLWEYKRKALRLVKCKYDENNIKIPYNQLEVHNAK